MGPKAGRLSSGSSPWETPWASGMSLTPLFSDSEDGPASGAGGGCHRVHLPGIFRALRGQAQALPGRAQGAAAEGAAHLDPGEHLGGQSAGRNCLESAELGTSSEQVGYRRGCEEGTPEREWTWQEARCPHLREQKSRHTCCHAGLLGGRMAAHSRHSASSGRAQGHGHGRMTRTGRLRLAPRRAQEAWTAQEGRVGRGTLPPQPAPPPPPHRRSCESVTTINS